MALPDQAAAAYPRWWSTALYAASHDFTSTDLVSAAADIARQEGQPLTFSEGTGIAQLYGYARNIATAADRLGAADDSAPITGDMISQAPFASSVQVQQAIPVWYAQTEVTYLDPEGNEVTGWRTWIKTQVLPTSVGALRQRIADDLGDLLSQNTIGSPASGQLTSIGQVRLMAV